VSPAFTGCFFAIYGRPFLVVPSVLRRSAVYDGQVRIVRRILLAAAVLAALVGYVIAAAVRAAPEVRARKARLREERAAAARSGSG
jgi:hypothetical protein